MRGNLIKFKEDFKEGTSKTFAMLFDISLEIWINFM